MTQIPYVYSCAFCDLNILTSRVLFYHCVLNRVNDFNQVKSVQVNEQLSLSLSFTQRKIPYRQDVCRIGKLAERLVDWSDKTS